MNGSLLSSYPSDSLLRKYKSIKRELLAAQSAWLDKRVAILGGSTTADIRKMLELHLLSHGIRSEFYESEYAQYWQDAMFGTPELVEFHPDIIFIHTTNRNITRFPEVGDSSEACEVCLADEFERFSSMWDKLSQDFVCPIIQNNFEYPYYRIMGNAEASLPYGKINFITRLNMKFYEYAQSHKGFFINDINWISADYGLEAWADPFYWHMYKYALATQAIPRLSQNVANIIKSLYGKNKKAFALDLDNTLWGGIVGDDGVENLQIGQETSAGQVYSEFQDYIKAHKKLGIILNVLSKNEAENAIAGLNHPDGVLKQEDFIMIKTNWEPKSQNLIDMGHELSLLPESFVFVDDNPAEREIVRRQVENACVPEIGDRAEYYIKAIDKNAYFEVTALTTDDMSRGEMYKDNAARSQFQSAFANYDEYLRSLEMKATIKVFEQLYNQRIAQLTNKSNQFNLTTLRCTQEEIEAFSADARYITLYGKLSDRFGDNGVVSVVIGEIGEGILHIRLWLMSCRVLKRGMEYAMMDELVRIAKDRGIAELRGYYYPTAKNAIVKDFYEKQGFELVSEDENGNKNYRFEINNYEQKQSIIKVNMDKGD